MWMFKPECVNSALIVEHPSAIRNAAAGATAGSGTITELDAEHITGTFSFVAPASPGSTATGTRTVTEGEFDIEFNTVAQ